MASKRGKRRKAERKECGTKFPHPTQAAAQQVAYYVNRRNGKYAHPLTPYRCKHCKFFHFGHAPKHVLKAMKK